MMKKRITQVLSIMAIIISFCSIPVSALNRADADKFSANNILFYDPQGNCSTSFNLDGIDASGEFNENAILIMARLISDGYSAEAAAGVLGNLKAEGGAFNAGEVENGYADDVNSSSWRITTDWTCYDRCGFGIAQWTTGSRQLALQAFADQQGKPVTSIEVQADFLVKELTDRGYPADTLNGMSIEEVTFNIFRYYETPRSSFQVGEYKGKYYNDYDPKTLDSLSETKTPAAYSAFKTRLSYAYGALQTINDNNLAARAVRSSSSSSADTSGENVTIIGDSITVRSESDILEKLPKADIYAQVSKQFYTGDSSNKGGYEILSELVENNSARNIIVYALGTNSGSLSIDQINSVIEKAGPSRKVILVNNYAVSGHDYTSNNNAMSTAASNNANVSVANWNGAVSSNPSVYMDDDVHPKVGAGTELFANTIYNAVVSVSGNAKYNTCSTSGTLLYGKCFSEGSGCTEDGFTYYFQSDAPWGTTMMLSGCDSTLAESGCGVTATSMVYTALTGTLILPTDVLSKVQDTGQIYHSCGHGGYHTVPGMVADQYGLRAEKVSLTRNTSSDKSAVETVLRSGGMLIGVVGPGGAGLTSGGHFIAVRGIDNNGDWKIFTSSRYNYGDKVNDHPFSPSSILDAFYSSSNTSYLWAIYK